MRFAWVVGGLMAAVAASGCSSSGSSPSNGSTSSNASSSPAGSTTAGSAASPGSGSTSTTASSSPTLDGSAGGDATLGDGGSTPFSFFVTSVGSGVQGGNLGGLAGADAKCQTLATAVGAGARTWHAYLSIGGATPVNARDRIGSGPWYNVRGVKIADDLAQLHEEDGGANNLSGATALDENGKSVPTANSPDAGTRNEHDILTGSDMGGRALPDTPDRTCAAWTSSTAMDAGGAVPVAEVGHANRMGTNAPPASMSWNSSHTTMGCAQADLQRVGGAGRLYCFAIH